MTTATASKNIDPITYADYERIRQTALQARHGESPEEVTLRGAIGIASIGLMRDAMLEDDEATTALWNDLEQAADGSGLLTIAPRKPSTQAKRTSPTSRKQQWTHSPRWPLPCKN